RSPAPSARFSDPGCSLSITRSAIGFRENREDMAAWLKFSRHPEGAKRLKDRYPPRQFAVRIQMTKALARKRSFASLRMTTAYKNASLLQDDTRLPYSFRMTWIPFLLRLDPHSIERPIHEHDRH